MADSSSDTDLSGVFGIVANGTRFEILQALWEAHTENPEEIAGSERAPVPFSRLRERVGVRDSGRFNYHLDELVPQFVRKRDDGYVLTHAGTRVIGAAVSGIYTESDLELDTTVMGDCTERSCSGTLEAKYENGHVTVSCDTCSLQAVMHVPPLVVESHGIEASPDIVQQYTLTELQRVARGFCLLCSGRLDTRVSDSQQEDESGDRVRVTHECRECGNIAHTTAVMCIFDHPAVVSLLHEAGIDYREIAPWQPPAALEYNETIQNEDPLRVAVTLTVDGETLTAVTDEDFGVLEWRRGEGGDPPTAARKHQPDE